jgi:4-amino-4-deoxychorismate lyase
MLVNGKSGNLISIRDRGLLYGDGVFRTLLARNGIALYRQQHLQKIQQDSAKLGIICPALSRLSAELDEVLSQHPDGIIKLIVTRGQGSRGYAPPTNVEPNLIWDVAATPQYPVDWHTQGVRVHVCDTRLSEQVRLAGIKHLNRLENVLAAAENEDADIAEGLLLDGQGRVIEGTRSNLFLLRGGCLITPELTRCGVAGVHRDRVLAYAQEHDMVVQIRDVMLAEVYSADELFLVNSVIGVWSVRELADRRWQDHPFAKHLRTELTRGEPR